jgi:hypothetical protein
MVDQGIADQECIATHSYTNEKSVSYKEPIPVKPTKPVKDSSKKEVTRRILWR